MLYIAVEFVLVLSVESMDQITSKVLCVDVKNKYRLLFSIEYFHFPFC